ncbi:hypothetical protein SDRG_00530 [Saprolegnia diclina VS20]|uniref:Cyclic nucleotide-binding domain-containing protein n=1 Tax=Saprolegnia diclina (strain VS20) TaxID=1156394 RepID=T0R8K8_SAPDV|nr:hypothetical protein SDRG_00530 [Saprolegnia diclina VS20]EQC42810.1 hypothetical protein SDRG_00530 [Saprolegnia diclina VS20]|eukprot:XP_008604233.1 hypothetical protein SDRG_00530 [Saprolegnia diclina VS20]
MSAKTSRECRVLASAKALGLSVGDGVSAADALRSHNAPKDEVFDKTLYSTTRIFLRQIARHKALPKHARGKKANSAPVASLKCILLADNNRHRRDALALQLDGAFKVLLASSVRDVLQVVQMFTVHLVFVRAAIGRDSAATMLDALRHKGVAIPVVVGTSRFLDEDNPDMLRACLERGALGHLDDSVLTSLQLRDRLLELIEALGAVDKECQTFKNVESKVARRRSTLALKSGASTSVLSSIMQRRGSTLVTAASSANLRRPSDSKLEEVDTKIFDRQMLMQKRAQVASALQVDHSALGLTATPAPSPLPVDLQRTPVPKPTRNDINKNVYTHPHKVAAVVQAFDYDRRTRPEKSVACQEPLLEHCLALDPKTLGAAAESRLNKAYLFYAQGRLDMTIHWCSNALATEPFNLPKWVHLLRGAAHDKLGDHALALHDFTAAVAIDAKCHEAHFNASVALLKLGRDKDALAAIERAQASAEGSCPSYMRNYALILRRLGRFDDARVAYAQLDPSQSDDDIDASLDGLLESLGLRGGLLDALFCQSKVDKAGFFAKSGERSDEMLDAMAAVLRSFDFFVRMPDDVVRRVCQAGNFTVIRCGDAFELAAAMPTAFYVCVSGTLSVHANLKLSAHEAVATASTLRLHAGAIFGCVGYSVSNLMMYLADERTEVLYLAPKIFKATLEPQWILEQHARFATFRRSPVFRSLSDSELGHIVSHSILARFTKGSVIIAQGSVPKHLYLLYKGICRFQQTFADGTNDTSESAPPTTALAPPVAPFHHLLADASWPLGYTRPAPTLAQATSMPQLDVRRSLSRAKRATNGGALPAITYELYPPALFGETAYLEASQKAKCSIIANTLVEVLAVDVHQLKSLSTAKDLLMAIARYAPMYVDAARAEKLQADHDAWTEVRGKEALLLNKARWPIQKSRLRFLPNGSSLVLPDECIVTSPKR